MADDSPDDGYLPGFMQTLFGDAQNTGGMAGALLQGQADRPSVMPALSPQAQRDMLLAMQDPDLQKASAALPSVAPVHVPTGAPAAVAQSLPVAAASAEKLSPSSGDDRAALGQMIESKRPNLGLEGDVMRGVLWPGFTRDMFDNYWQGGGQGVQLSGPRFKDIADYASTQPMPTGKDIGWFTGPNGETLQKRLYNFYGSPDYRRSLGKSTLFYDRSGKPVGFYDTYNFDPSTGKRTGLAELETRIMHVLGPLHGAKAFPIYYGDYTPIN